MSRGKTVSSIEYIVKKKTKYKMRLPRPDESGLAMTENISFRKKECMQTGGTPVLRGWG